MPPRDDCSTPAAILHACAFARREKLSQWAGTFGRDLHLLFATRITAMPLRGLAPSTTRPSPRVWRSSATT